MLLFLMCVPTFLSYILLSYLTSPAKKKANVTGPECTSMVGPTQLSKKYRFRNTLLQAPPHTLHLLRNPFRRQTNTIVRPTQAGRKRYIMKSSTSEITPSVSIHTHHFILPFKQTLFNAHFSHPRHVSEKVFWQASSH